MMDSVESVDMWERHSFSAADRVDAVDAELEADVDDVHVREGTEPETEVAKAAGSLVPEARSSSTIPNRTPYTTCG